MSRLLVYGACALPAIYVGLCLALFIGQRSLIYFPRRAAFPLGRAVVTVSSGEPRVVASVRPRDGDGALLYFGGNAEDVSQTLPSLANVFPERALYLLQYRGYGESAGKPSEGALLEDGLALFDHVHAKHARVLVVGRSLGTGIATHVASQRPTERLVLVTPYDSLTEVAAAQVPYFPVRWLLRDQFESFRNAPRIKAPTLLVAAEHDEIIPLASTERLHAHFTPGVASLKVVPGATHNSISEHAEYTSWLRDKEGVAEGAE